MSGPAGDQGAPAERVAVLLDYPLRLWAAQGEYFEGLLREFTLLRLADEQLGADAAPSRLLQLARDVELRFGPTLLAVNAERKDAYDRGLDRMDVRMPLVHGVPAVLETIRVTLEQCDDFCRDRQLLSLPRPPVLLAFGTWVGDQLVGQHDGAAPTPWPGPF
jgi:hypothetical protein